MSDTPKVTVGIPVYNGENYLAAALDCLLAQTFQDFEVVISDNASTDGTRRIAEAYAGRDPRIRYYVNQENLGAARNYNILLDYARGLYFKWAAHDDIIAPTYLETCVAVLDADPSYVLAYTLAIETDANGNELARNISMPGLDARSPAKRLHSHACNRRAHQNTVFGVIRTDALRRTRLIDAFSASDQVLNGELALLGRFYEVPEYLFFKRNHAQTHWQTHKTMKERMAWYDPKQRGSLRYPYWRVWREFLRSIGRAPISAVEKAKCGLSMVWWMRLRWRWLAAEMLHMDTP